MPYLVYILQSALTGQFYVGHTANLQLRLLRHNQGRVPSTRSAGPWSLVYSEAFATRSLAMRRETQIKRQHSRSYMYNLIHPLSSALD